MKKIIVTGSTSGIGKAITLKLLDDNHCVIGLARQHNKLQAENYIPFTIDFSQMNSLENSLKEVAALVDELEAVIISAGYGKFAYVEQWSLQDMQTMMNVNFLSQAMVIKALLPRMKQAKKGRIIVIGSESALQGNKLGGMYCASKFALRGFCQSLRKECASSNITVTLINPGLTRTPFFDDLSFKPADGYDYAITPEQVADCVVQCLNMASNCVVEEINLQPLVNRVDKT